MRQSWKGYYFGLLNELREKEFLGGSARDKSVYLTEVGIKKAEELVKKYYDELD
ncbi:DUF6429 family protein [Bacillus sp. THAF10]|uniref:DUF6429 family protein n=1 Tax=Bacillus sp. THAF10 TaxID=2587848 RepID=UPI001C12C35E|nr:DUF6429 family protein [Bacillus sp. THAF10]